MSGVTLTLAEAPRLATAAFVAADTTPDTPASVAAALVLAETDGQKDHGLSRVAARRGFAYPALEAGIAAAAEAVAETGTVAVAVANSHHFGVAGHSVEKLARGGLLGLVLGNTPAAIAPWGGTTPLFGTNPIAFACPRRDAEPLVIDLSLSRVARGRIMVAAQRSESIPEGWALDAEGRPTTDAKAALEGAMLPMDDARGAALVLMVEVLAAALAGSNFGFEASSFFSAEGEPPRVGRLLLAFDPVAFNPGFLDRIDALSAAILAHPGTRLPGLRRFELRRRAERDGLAVPDALYRDLVARAMA